MLQQLTVVQRLQRSDGNGIDTSRSIKRLDATDSYSKGSFDALDNSQDEVRTPKLVIASIYTYVLIYINTEYIVEYTGC